MSDSERMNDDDSGFYEANKESGDHDKEDIKGKSKGKKNHKKIIKKEKKERAPHSSKPYTI